MNSSRAIPSGFVRFMDDIDVGADSQAEAKHILKCIDLVLQTKQVRLNSGKTLILSRQDALAHFRVVENARLDRLKDRITKRKRSGLGLLREKRLIELRVERGMRDRWF